MVFLEGQGGGMVDEGEREIGNSRAGAERKSRGTVQGNVLC